MAGITKEIAEEKLNIWLEAMDKVANKQSYSIDGRSLTYANLSEIQNMVDYWDAKVSALSSGNKRGKARLMRVSPTHD